jgi:hypothetical protein
VYTARYGPFHPQKPPPVSPYVAPPETAVPVKTSFSCAAIEQPPRRQLLVGEFILEYELRRSTRRSIGFMIDDDGLRVTAPKRISIAEIDEAIRTKQHWILSKLKERRERRARAAKAAGGMDRRRAAALSGRRHHLAPAGRWAQSQHLQSEHASCG